VSPGEGESKWDSVIARALCFISLSAGDLRDKPLSRQAKHLEALGLTRKEAAGVLGTSADSITELYRQQKKSRKRGGNGKKR
jgi:hypothetical protein